MTIEPARWLKEYSSTYQDEQGKQASQITKKIKEKKEKNLITLTSGDPVKWGGFKPPEHVAAALIEAVERGLFYYPQYYPEGDTKKLMKEAICERESRVSGVECSPDDLVVLCGGTHGIQMFEFALMNPEDEMIVFEPTYNGFVQMSNWHKFRWTSCKTIEERDEWIPDIDGLRRKIGPKTKAILVVNPNNPTGSLFSEKQLKEIVNIAGSHNCLVVVDELYDSITFDGLKTTSIASVAGDVPCMSLNAVSKHYCLPGLRMGYMRFHDPAGKTGGMAKKISKYVDYLNPLATVVHMAAIAALRGSTDHIKTMVKELEKRRDYTYKRMNEIQGIRCAKPRGSFFAFPKVEGIGKIWKDDLAFVLNLLEEQAIQVQPGPMFAKEYGNGHFRTSLLPPVHPTLEEAWDRLEVFMNRHKA